MAKFAKWVAGGLGWAIGGPIGGVLGFALGAMFDTTELRAGEDTNQSYTSAYRHRTTADDFTKALLVLAAAITKADGKVLQVELDYIKSFFTQQFGKQKADEVMLVFSEVIKMDIPLRDVCEQIKYNMEHPSRLQLLHFLFSISASDGQVDKTELLLIEQVAGYLGISKADYESIKAMFWKDKESAYKILEISSSADNEEIKRAYRKMALKYHPDKIAHLGDDFKSAAHDKFLKVQEAYELIKKERGL